ncbi:S8 family serine peptidase [bacterium]|nr:S8 family serine peptidase [bacterium]
MPDEIRYIQTDNTPDFLDLNAPGGPYARGFDGEGVVVGVIDTGIWPEHPSFSDDGTYAAAPGSFVGTGCEFGSAVAGAQAFNPNDVDFACNNKLLAAKVYGLGFHGGVGIGIDPGSYLSARDEDGHGTHTTSTAAGNADVPVSLQGGDLGTMSGIAPRAHVSVYKACWSVDPENGGCATSDLVAAIDQAVADGVDVINYSIGSSAATIGADDISFLFADDAGVFVATSAGNDGPGAATVGSPAVDPWVTSVGASTQSREFIGTVTLGDASVYEGITVTGGTGELDLVNAADHGNVLCDPTVTFVPAITGDIVLCTRGVFARVAKSQAVAEQGGAGMILFNPSLSTLNTDNHYVPSLHVDHVDGPAIAAYIAANPGTATATLSGGVATATDGNVMAAFSSRGPNGLSGDIIKPDVTAPGVNILAGNTPTALLGSPGELFQSISGTSMSSPHVAGIFALIKEARPRWTPAIAKSALMTTGYQDVFKEDGVTAADPLDFGAGHVGPGGKSNKGSLFQPGLAYDAGLFEYAAFTCGANLGVFTAGTCDFLESIGVPIDPSDLNVPSIGVAELVGSQTVVRTITSVTMERGWRTYEASVEAPPGFDVTVSPSSLYLKRGMSATFEVTITNNGGATLGEWAFGSLTWNDTTGLYDVRSPIAVRAFEFAADDAVHGTGDSGTAEIDVAFGYDGDYSAAAHGLEPATMQPDLVVDDPANDINTALFTGVGVTWHLVTVPAGTAYTRISLFDGYTDGADDLDLYVFSGGGTFLGGSGSGTSAEQVDLVFPAADTLQVAVHGWQTDGPDSIYTLFDWSVSATPGGSLAIGSAPAAAVLGTTGTVVVDWTGLAAGKYLGAVSHTGPGAVLLGLTLVGVDVP